MSAMTASIGFRAGDHVMHIDGRHGVVREVLPRNLLIVDWEAAPAAGCSGNEPILSGFLQRIANVEMHP
jgi:hypothetical protein